MEHGCERGCFAAACGARDEDDSIFFLNDFPKDRWQAERVKRRDLRLQLSHDDGWLAVLFENVDAKTRNILERITAIARTPGGQIVQEPLIAIDNVIGKLIDFFAPENRRWRFNQEFFQPTVRLDKRRFTDCKKQI